MKKKITFTNKETSLKINSQYVLSAPEINEIKEVINNISDKIDSNLKLSDVFKYLSIYIPKNIQNNTNLSIIFSKDENFTNSIEVKLSTHSSRFLYFDNISGTYKSFNKTSINSNDAGKLLLFKLENLIPSDYYYVKYNFGSENNEVLSYYNIDKNNIKIEKIGINYFPPQQLPDQGPVEPDPDPVKPDPDPVEPDPDPVEPDPDPVEPDLNINIVPNVIEFPRDWYFVWDECSGYLTRDMWSAPEWDDNFDNKLLGRSIDNPIGWDSPCSYDNPPIILKPNSISYIKENLGAGTYDTFVRFVVDNFGKISGWYQENGDEAFPLPLGTSGIYHSDSEWWCFTQTLCEDTKNSFSYKGTFSSYYINDINEKETIHHNHYPNYEPIYYDPTVNVEVKVTVDYDHSIITTKTINIEHTSTIDSIDIIPSNVSNFISISNDFKSISINSEIPVNTVTFRFKSGSKTVDRTLTIIS